MRIIKCVLALFIIVSCQMVFAATDELASQAMTVKAVRINDAYIHDGKAEVFMDLQNNGDAAHTLVAVYSPVAAQVQLHQTLDKENHMKRATSIMIPSHKDQDLHYGGLHVMLLGLKKPLSDHQKVPVTLIFSDGSWLKVEAKVFSVPQA